MNPVGKGGESLQVGIARFKSFDNARRGKQTCEAGADEQSEINHCGSDRMAHEGTMHELWDHDGAKIIALAIVSMWKFSPNLDADCVVGAKKVA